MSTLQVATIKSASSAAPVFQNSSGTEKGQLIKAWIQLNGTGTISITNSFNVSSIADTGTGRNTINFTNAFSNANYCMAGSHNNFSDGVCVVGENGLVGFSTSAAAIQTTVYNALSDPARVRVIFIGDN